MLTSLLAKPANAHVDGEVMTTVPKTFADDFELWAQELLREGDTTEGVEEIRQDIRKSFAEGGEGAEYWKWRVANEAALIRSNRLGDENAPQNT